MWSTFRYPYRHLLAYANGKRVNYASTTTGKQRQNHNEVLQEALQGTQSQQIHFFFFHGSFEIDLKHSISQGQIQGTQNTKTVIINVVYDNNFVPLFISYCKKRENTQLLLLFSSILRNEYLRPYVIVIHYPLYL